MCVRRPRMTAILRAALLTSLVAASVPTVAAGQGTSIDSLLRRIDVLEHRTIDLEQRVRELEALIKAEPTPSWRIPASANWRDLANWRRLRVGMTMDEVRALLSEPKRVDVGPWTYWRYSDHANVYFDTRSGTVLGWSEP
jgi:hypothetical protein